MSKNNKGKMDLDELSPPRANAVPPEVKEQCSVSSKGGEAEGSEEESSV